MIKRLMCLFLVAAIVTVGMVCPRAFADRLTLKDGRVLEGKVEREGPGFIYFILKIGGVDRTELFTSDQIVRIERDGDAPAQAPATKANPVPVAKPETRPGPSGATDDGAAAAAAAAAAAGAAATGAAPTTQEPAEALPAGTRVCFVTLEETVGMYLNADALLKSVELVKDEKPDVIVLWITSGGGALLEVEPLSDAIHKKLKKDYRVVAWIRSAISAAAMTAWNCEEIYMMKEGNIGAATAFRQEGGRNVAASGEMLEQILRVGEELSKRGKRNPLIMRAMQVHTDLSCDIDENGLITWYDNLKGQTPVITKDRILTFNSADAIKFGISRGTADTKADLLSLMGVSEWVEVGSKADEYQRDFREGVKVAEARVGELLQKYQLAIDAAGTGSTDQERARHVGRARSVLNELRGVVRRAPSFEKYTILTPTWFQEREEELRKLASRT